MNLKINLAKNTFIYYCIIGPLISIFSLFNVVNGVLLHKSTIISIGAFSLFGFILIPLGLFKLYVNNKCIITADRMQIGKTDYIFSNHTFQIVETLISFKNRPIFSPFKKINYNLIIKNINTNRIIFETDLDVFRKDLENIKNALPII